MFLTVRNAFFAFSLTCGTLGSVAAFGETVTSGSAAGASAAAAPDTVPCEALPTGNLTEDDLKRFVPDGSPGKVRIRWKTESQEDTYGFSIMRADKLDGTYQKINKSVIPGEGTTNIPREYCYEDTGVERSKVYYYQIVEITNQGAQNVVEGTAGTKVTVKSVAEERAWLKKKAAEGSGASTGTQASQRQTETSQTGMSAPH